MPSPDELLEPHTPEHREFTSMALRPSASTGPLLAITLYRRLDEAGRPILIEMLRVMAQDRV